MARLACIALGLCLLFGAAGCEDDPLTQLVVVVDSNWDGFSRIEVEVGGFVESASTSADLDDDPLPRRFAIVHEGGPLGPIDVTTRAYVDDVGDLAVLVEPRSGIRFERGRTLLLRVGLRFECIGECRDDQACLEGGRCVEPDEAVELTEWNGPPESLPVTFRVEDSDVVRVLEDDSGMTMVVPVQDGGPADGGGVDGSPDAGDAGDAGGSGGRDAGPSPDPPMVVESGFDYVTSNFDPQASPVADAERVAVLIDCPRATFDSTDLTFAD